MIILASTKVFVLTNELSPNAIGFNYPLLVNPRRLANRCLVLEEEGQNLFCDKIMKIVEC